MAITVLIADDDALVRELVRELLRSASDLELVAESTNGLDAVAAAAEYQPDVALLDVRMPNGGGEAVQAVRRVSPGTAVLAFSSLEHEAPVLEMINAGAQGYLLKGTPALDLCEAIRATARGETPISGPAATAVVGHLRNLSSRVEDLVRRTERLEVAKEEFIQILAHELLTPTTVMQASADTVSRFAGSGDVEILRELAERQSAAALRLKRIVDNLTLAAQLRDPSWLPQREPTGVREVVDRACIRAEVPSERLAVHCDDGLQVSTDEALLSRAVSLVLENAVHHAHAIEVHVERGTERLAFIVQDDGPGFPDGFHSDAFTQADSSTTRAHGGLGIGLYLTSLIMDRIDGDLDLGRAPRGGAEVRLTVPAR